MQKTETKETEELEQLKITNKALKKENKRLNLENDRLAENLALEKPDVLEFIQLYNLDLRQKIVELKQEIEQLKHDLAVKERALELACKQEQGANSGNPFFVDKWELKDYINDYLDKAEKELKGEK